VLQCVAVCCSVVYCCGTSALLACPVSALSQLRTHSQVCCRVLHSDAVCVVAVCCRVLYCCGTSVLLTHPTFGFLNLALLATQVCCGVLQCLAVSWSVLNCVVCALYCAAVCCRRQPSTHWSFLKLQYVAECCRAVQCVAACCDVCRRRQPSISWPLMEIQVCCSVLQCVAVYCSVLQCLEMCCSVSLQTTVYTLAFLGTQVSQTATLCNTL